LVIPEHEPVAPLRSFAFLGELAKFVSSSPWDSAFNIFKIEANSITPVASVRQKFSLLSTINCAGRSLLLASWRDSSLTLWNIADTKSALKPLYRKRPHLASLVDVEANPQLRLIASLDKNRKCILSMLDTGSFVRSFVVEGDDTLERIMLLSPGYLLVLSRVETAASIKTTIRAYGINTRKIAQAEFEHGVADWCRGEFETWMSTVAIAFRRGPFVILSVPSLTLACTLRPEEQIGLLAFSPQMGSFLAGTESGRLLMLNLT
jgi:hypothetical protein